MSIFLQLNLHSINIYNNNIFHKCCENINMHWYKSEVWFINLSQYGI
jgi:hypothetical protein